MSYPASVSQQRLWFLDQFEGTSIAYHIRHTVHLRGELNRDALGRAIDTIVARHEILRTYFVEAEGEVIQNIRPTVKITLAWEDLSRLALAEREKSIAHILRREGDEPFDLSRGPLLRGILLKLAESEHVLSLTFHHIVCDGWSIGIFNRELTALYGAFCPGQNQTLLEAMLTEPERPVSEVPMLTVPERNQVLVEWNRTEREYPRDKCVHQLFEEQVERTPEAVAVIFDGESLTYRELNVRANQLAYHLRSLGVGPDVLVALCVERSLEMVAALLAILKAGGAYVPIDPKYPRERIEFILQDTEAPVFMTQRSLDLKFSGARRIYLEEAIPQTAANPVAVPTTAAGLAYVIYTSGSTGKPKGVAIEHHSTVTFLHWVRDSFSDAELSGVLASTSICFDLSVFEIFGPLSWGGCVLLVNNALDLWSVLGPLDATLINTVPSVLAELLRGRRLPASVRTLNLAGEPLRQAMVDAVFKNTSIEHVNDLYGPTETTTYSTWARRALGGVETIGRPIARTQIYILDDHGQPVPVGIPGELHIGGAGVARGYWRRPDLTAERFVNLRFSNGSGGRFFKTGDRAKWREDGQIEFLGRRDNQVKIRGHRIELGEIEAVLSEHPDVSACTVATQSQGGEDRTIAAFIVGRERADISMEPLRRWLGEKLPDYMIPSRFFVLPDLPLTSNGKVDRKALEKMEGVELTAGNDPVSPHTDLQSQLIKLWQTVLGREQIGIHDDFFDLGGHSLLAMRLIARIQADLQVDVSLRVLFEFPTIAGMAESLVGVDSASASALPALVPFPRHGALPLSFAQQRLWFLDRFEGASTAYHIASNKRLRGDLNSEALGTAINAIVARHECLRTRFVEIDGEATQVIQPVVEIKLQLEDLRGLAAAQREQSTAAILRRERERPFALSQGPLLRGILLRLGEREHILSLSFHHIVFDGWSVGVFNRELAALYGAFCSGQGVPLKPLTVQYADYALWQRHWLQGEELERQLNYWREHLRDAPTLNLGTDRPRPARLTYTGARHAFMLSPTLSAQLKDFNQAEKVTPFMSLLAAFQVLLSRHSGQADILVGTPIANRQKPELDSLIGFFVNTLVLRTNLSGQPAFRGVVARVRTAALAAFAHQDLPFERLVEELNPERDLSRHPVFQVMFALQNAPAHPLALPGMEVTPFHSPAGLAHFDLGLELSAEGDSWAGSFTYNTDLFDAVTIQRMECHYKTLLQAMLTEPERPVSEVPMLMVPERNQVLVEWNRTEREYSRNKCVHPLFEEQVERTPEAVAVIFEGQSLTYRALNRRANQLAHHLRGLGVGPDVLVGLCVERSLEMFVALLGILKAGGAYVPLDPHLPSQRLAYLLRDIGTPLVLVQQRWRDGVIRSLDPAHPSPRILILEELPTLLVAATSANPPCINTPDHLAYVMYTSGTTGQPKGVMIPHRGIVRLVINPDYVALAPRDVLLQFAPLAFDASTFEIWGSLLNGAKLVVLPPGPVDYRELGGAITRHGVTTLWLTAGLFHEMLEYAPAALARVRQLLAGGDVLSPAKVRSYLELPGHGRLINGYGPTENTTFTCCCGFDRAEQIGESVPLGRPIAGTQVYILDRHGQPLPVGVTGEIYTGGDGLARGYLNAPTLTSERFIADPFSLDPRARLYKTGDLARWLPDGNIQFIGRLDQQVKIRGYRVELGEIETVLRAQPEVREAVVLLREDTPGDRRLVAYLVAHSDKKPDESTLRTRLGATLPDYMLPNAFVWIHQLPLTSNGKLDRKALPAPESGVEGKPGDTDQPINIFELELLRLWRRLFHREDIGRNDSFFDLGGHSLLAARLTTEIDKLLSCKLPISALFQSPTVASLTRRLTAENWTPPWKSLVPLQPLGAKPPFFLVHGWGGDVFVFLGLAQQLAPDQPAYGLQAVGLDGKLARHTTLEHMAAHYVQEIRSFQPEGPYYLGGYSMGGLIAFEMAQQLHRQGQRVALLALFDTVPICVIPWTVYGQVIPSYLYGRLRMHLRRWWKLPNQDRREYFRGRWAALQHWMVRNRTSLPVTPVGKPAESPPVQMGGSSDYYVALASAYRLHRYPGSADIFVSEHTNPHWASSWKQLVCGGVSYHRVPGTHLELLTPKSLPVLSNALRTALLRAQNESIHAHSAITGAP